MVALTRKAVDDVVKTLSVVGDRVTHSGGQESTTSYDSTAAVALASVADAREQISMRVGAVYARFNAMALGCSVRELGGNRFAHVTCMIIENNRFLFHSQLQSGLPRMANVAHARVHPPPRRHLGGSRELHHVRGQGEDERTPTYLHLDRQLVRNHLSSMCSGFVRIDSSIS